MNNLEIKVNNLKTNTSVSSEQRRILELVLNKVPTGGNSKPFCWTWDGDELLVVHDMNLAEHYLNRNLHTSKIAFGCLIESLQIACESLSLTPQMKIDEQELSLRIAFSSQFSAVTSRVSVSALLARSTYRGLMQNSQTSNQLSQELGSMVFVSQTPSLDLIQYLKISANYIWHHQKATLDFFKEIRFFSKFKSSEMRGIPTSELHLPLKDLIALKIFSLMPKLLKHLMKIKHVENIFFENSQRLLENSKFVLVCAPSTSTTDLIEAGRRALKIWLELESRGFQVQPLSTATIPIVDAIQGVLPEDTSALFRDFYVHEGSQLLKKEFGALESLQPVWLFRFGKKK